MSGKRQKRKLGRIQTPDISALTGAPSACRVGPEIALTGDDSRHVVLQASPLILLAERAHAASSIPSRWFPS